MPEPARKSSERSQSSKIIREADVDFEAVRRHMAANMIQESAILERLSVTKDHNRADRVQIAEPEEPEAVRTVAKQSEAIYLSNSIPGAVATAPEYGAEPDIEQSATPLIISHEKINKPVEPVVDDIITKIEEETPTLARSDVDVESIVVDSEIDLAPLPEAEAKTQWQMPIIELPAPAPVIFDQTIKEINEVKRMDLNELLAGLQLEVPDQETPIPLEDDLANFEIVNPETVDALAPVEKVTALFEEQIALLESPEEVALAGTRLEAIVELVSQLKALEESDPEQTLELTDKLQDLCIQLLEQLHIDYDETDLRALMATLLKDEQTIEPTEPEPVKNIWYEGMHEIKTEDQAILSILTRFFRQSILPGQLNLGKLALTAAVTRL